MPKDPVAIAFQGDVCIAAGDLAGVALAAQKAARRHHHEPILIFDAATSEPIEIDLRDGGAQRLSRPAAAGPAAPPAGETPRGPGRPKLGVVAHEVTLLPRHWDWLASQPGGASVALRKLVEYAMRANAGKDRIRASQNAAYRFMSAMAGNRVRFEDAARALFAGDAATFHQLVQVWPKDIRDHVAKLAAEALKAEHDAA
jgi:uncharacterized protein